MRHSTLAAALLAAGLLASPARALTISFDYTYDSTGFFANPARKNVLNLAASYFNGFADSLSAVVPSGSNIWSINFPNPATGTITTISNPSIAANTVVVYVGSRVLGGSTLGQGGPGGFGGSGNSTWISTIVTRGQSGAASDTTSTDNGPWGGALTFDSTTNWFFGTSDTGQGASQSDFLSVATHELGHLLGFGTANSFKHYTSGTTFIGPAAEAKHSGTAVPLDPGLGHWLNGTTSTINGFRSQETAMDPSLTIGTRKIFTDLDYAGMTDVGWQVRRPGDANTDGKITADDFALIDRGFDKHLTGWANGDFNADGSITSFDYLILDRAYLSQTGVAAPGLLAEREAQFGEAYAAQLADLVPEPTSLAACGLAALTLRRRRA